MLRLAVIATLILLGLSPLPVLAKQVRFNRDVLPILSNTCFTCHGPDSGTREADLRFDQEASAKQPRENGAAIVPHKPEESLLISAIHSSDPDSLMPPPDAVQQLTENEKAILRQWIAEGAKWEKHWSFIPPKRPPLPKVANATWPRNPIDAFILSRLEEEELTPSTEAAKEKLIRRLSLDLTGLPPTLKEVDAFLADQQPDAYERLVDRLLASPRYGETMAIPWLDAARFADTDGYQYDGPRQMWRWRDWVIDAYNKHMPFDQFTIEQLAGDLLPNPTLDQFIATGFNRNHRYNSESGLVVEEFLLENAVDRVDTTSTVWLGLTMGCARCHDHKYDPISQKDYYQLIAFFNNIPEAGRAIKAGNSEPYIPSPTKEQQPKLAELKRTVSECQAKLNSPESNARHDDWVTTVAKGEALIDKGLTQRGQRHLFSFDQTPPTATAKAGSLTLVPGVFGNALLLDGKSIVSIPNPTKKDKKAPTAFPNFRANDAYSLSFWIRPDEAGTGVVLARQSPGSGRPGVAVELRDGHLQFHVISRWIAGAGVVETEDKLKPGTWSHVTVTCDGSQRATRQFIYVNGVQAPVHIIHNTNSNVGGVAANAPFLIGGGVYGDMFKGAIDDFRIYTRALWPEEAFALAEPVYASKIAKMPLAERTPRQKATLRAWFQEHGPDKPNYDAYVQARLALEKFTKSLPTTMIMKENSVSKETFIRKRGVYNDYGERVERETPEQLPEMSPEFPKNRLGLAKWLVSEDNPLTARVTVNRYWQKYFGTGLVKTSEDFGLQGESPSHPELLDWLAAEFVQSGWDVAAMQKLIVTSATYRQAAIVESHLRQRDPENRLLARGPRIRLPGPVLRDQALFVSGLLVEKIGGPSTYPYQPANLWAEMSMGMKYKVGKGDSLYRRSLYTVWKRTVNPPSMAILDAADRESCWVGIKRTNTPLQALTLLNEPAFVEAARHLGERMMREGGEDPIAFAFRSTTSRRPTDRELDILNKAFAKYQTTYQSQPKEAAKIIATGASPTPKDLDPATLAAHTTIANIILNLDEVLTKE